jgi:hypothetical protein
VVGNSQLLSSGQNLDLFAFFRNAIILHHVHATVLTTTNEHVLVTDKDALTRRRQLEQLGSLMRH